MSKQFHFLGGLPRSGSTLLCNILAQNPHIHATHTSGCMDVMFGVRNNWDNLIEHRAHPEPDKLQRVLNGILNSYYQDVEKPVIIDKCRGWISLVEMAESVLGRQAKIIVPVRDINSILASFEKLWRKTAESGQVPGEGQNYFQFQTVEGRCAHWMQNSQVVGLAYNRLKDVFNRGLRDRLHLVDFDELTKNPSTTLNAIYQFLDVEPFEHDFNNVEQVTSEDDSVHGFKGLHTIRNRVEYRESNWKEIIGAVGDKYSGFDFWRI